jgi:hypothetical protein
MKDLHHDSPHIKMTSVRQDDWAVSNQVTLQLLTSASRNIGLVRGATPKNARGHGIVVYPLYAPIAMPLQKLPNDYTKWSRRMCSKVDIAPYE